MQSFKRDSPGAVQEHAGRVSAVARGLLVDVDEVIGELVADDEAARGVLGTHRVERGLPAQHEALVLDLLDEVPPRRRRLEREERAQTVLVRPDARRVRRQLLHANIHITSKYG